MKSNILKQRIQEGRFDDILVDLYQDKSQLDYQRNRYIAAIEKFEKLYGEDDVSLFSVPGRSEVSGNHTDHQNGKVLACAVNIDMIAVAAPNRSNFVNITSDNRKCNGILITDLKLKEEEKRSTRSLVKGVLKRLDDEMYRIDGFNAFMTSDVAVGSGLSSSAAFETMIGYITSGLFNKGEINPVVIAKAGQYAENVYFGKPCGLMDQVACSVGNLINIDFEDNDNPKVKKVQADFSKSGYSLCIVDSKGSHAHLTDDYAAIPYEMRSVCQVLGKTLVREINADEILENIDEIREKCGDRALIRALHVIYENDRVDEAVKALEASDFDTFLEVIRQSGNSSFKYLQNVYSNHSVQEQSLSVALMYSENILKDNGVCRVHGGGFAGTIQAFVKDEFVQTYKREIEKVFGEGCCHVLKVRKYGGKQIV
ncbi:MAG: galactokinase family protein [Bacillota bacterium]|jgi:galactokinase|nr:galactokinase family protein [Bacillota bacterium]NLL26617.1 galactokinase [Erysipelotrichia bacterium]